VTRASTKKVSLRSSAGPVTRRRGLQFVAGEMFVMTSIDAGDAGSIAGRLVISQGADRLSLFTGELSDPSLRWTIPPLTFTAGVNGDARVAYEGPLVGFRTLTPFVDLEQGLVGGTLIEGSVDLTFRADPSGDAIGSEECFGEVRGTVVVDGRSYFFVSARGGATNSEGWVPQRLPSCRITLPTSPWGSLALGVDPAEVPVWRDGCRLTGALVGTASTHGGCAVVRASCELQISSCEGSLVLEVGSGRPERLTGSLERLIPVRRPGRGGTVVETTFALVRVGGVCTGWVEVTVGREVSAPRPRPKALSAD